MASPSNQPPRLFERARVRAHRDRAARIIAQGGRDGRFLSDLAAEDLLERLQSISRTFATAIELGGGAFARLLEQKPAEGRQVAQVIACDLSASQLADAPRPKAVADAEHSPFAQSCADLIVSSLALHWVNDLPGALLNIRRTLKPDGLFLGALLGGRTLSELRECLAAAEAELTGGAAARVSPMIRLEDAAGLLQRAGFALPVADSEVREVLYETPFALLADLRAMGETAAFADRAPPLRRNVLMRAMELYQERFCAPSGRARATFEIISLHGWAPHPEQPQPKRPGSATVRLADALGVKERSAGEKAGRRS